MSCAILYADKSRTAIVTSSGTLGDGGVDRLADAQPHHRMRLNGSSANFTLDLGAVLAIDVFALISTTLDSDSTMRVRASASDPTATGSLAHDSGTLSAVTDAKWLGQIIHIPPATKNVRYVRWDLTVGSGASIDIGLAPLGALFRPTRNFSYGAQRGRQDYGVRDGNPRTGAMFGVSGGKARVQAIQFQSMTPGEIDADVTEMDRLTGVDGDVLWVPEAADVTQAGMLVMARDALWGGFRQVGQAQLSTHDSFQLLSRSYQMTERL